MRSKKYLWKVCEEIYQQMYAEAEPPLDFHKAVKEGYTAKPNWFMNHYLNQERQLEIISEITKKHHCSKYEVNMISLEVFLGSAPSGVIKDE